VLLSMTGFGQSVIPLAEGVCAVEVRTVNNRFFKLHAKLPESHAGLEARLEKTVRDHVRRGAVTMAVRFDRGAAAHPVRINAGLLKHLAEQVRGEFPVESGALLGALLTVPGVIEERLETPDLEADWPALERAATAALVAMHGMRRDEGAAMGRELSDLAKEIGAIADLIERNAERSVPAHRDRLLERVAALLADRQASVAESDLLRETAILAERFDIAEEIARLRSHCDQFFAILESDDSVGRKLEFLTQELHREANTLGAKANDAEIGKLTVELKTRIERVREIVQNVE